MVILKIGDEFADGDFSLLTRHLGLLDQELIRLNAAIAVSPDPDSEGYLEAGEYFVGHGFVAIQRYLTATRACLGVMMADAFAVPPMATNELSLAAAINAGANYWKHMEEWIETLNKTADAELKGNALKTLQQLETITPWAEYSCANLLAALLDGQPLELSRLLPQIEIWRANVFDLRSAKPVPA